LTEERLLEYLIDGIASESFPPRPEKERKKDTGMYRVGWEAGCSACVFPLTTLRGNGTSSIGHKKEKELTIDLCQGGSVLTLNFGDPIRYFTREKR